MIAWEYENEREIHTHKCFLYFSICFLAFAPFTLFLRLDLEARWRLELEIITSQLNFFFILQRSAPVSWAYWCVDYMLFAVPGTPSHTLPLKGLCTCCSLFLWCSSQKYTWLAHSYPGGLSSKVTLIRSHLLCLPTQCFLYLPFPSFYTYHYNQLKYSTVF